MKMVSIITRTKDRPLMLERAFKSVVNQRFKEYQWVIVNDGGNIGEVDDIANRAESKGIEVIRIHHDCCRGMEASSNDGIKASDGKYVVIHDDDDTWHPEFLERTVGYMESLPSHSSIKGVVTKVNKIHETIIGGRILTYRKSDYDPELDNVTLIKMARLDNIPPPISFLYRRDVLDDIGLYREDLQVLGDWEFNLRFLGKYDLGVITEKLANYHIRAGILEGAYGNTIVSQRDLHSSTLASLKNEFLRRDLETGRIGIGYIVNMAGEFQELHNGSFYVNRIYKNIYRLTLGPAIMVYRSAKFAVKIALEYLRTS